jgi:hypothetical protein
MIAIFGPGMMEEHRKKFFENQEQIVSNLPVRITSETSGEISAKRPTTF